MSRYAKGSTNNAPEPLQRVFERDLKELVGRYIEAGLELGKIEQQLERQIANVSVQIIEARRPAGQQAQTEK